MVLNHQTCVALSLPAVRTYVRRLRGVLRLGRRDFNVCFLDDRGIARLNGMYRGKRRPTDVLSFPWKAPEDAGRNAKENGEFKDFLGDVVISTETVRRHARSEGHSTQDEIRRLILHGLLHLVGYDHETDDGEMTALELSLRERLGIQGAGVPKKEREAASGIRQW